MPNAEFLHMVANALEHLNMARDDAKDGEESSANAHAHIAYERLRDWFNDH